MAGAEQGRGAQTIIRPQPRPQTAFLASPADIAIYGGSAGGGIIILSGGKCLCELEPVGPARRFWREHFSVRSDRSQHPGGILRMGTALVQVSQDGSPVGNLTAASTRWTWPASFSKPVAPLLLPRAGTGQRGSGQSVGTGRSRRTGPAPALVCALCRSAKPLPRSTCCWARVGANTQCGGRRAAESRTRARDWRASHDSSPFVISIQSQVVFGHVGNSAALFPTRRRGQKWRQFRR